MAILSDIVIPQHTSLQASERDSQQEVLNPSYRAPGLWLTDQIGFGDIRIRLLTRTHHHEPATSP